MMLGNLVRRVLQLLLASGCLIGGAFADVLSWDLERQEWSTQVGSTPLTGAYQLNTSISGTGLGESSLLSPLATNAVSGSSLQRGWSTNFTFGTDATSIAELAATVDRAFPAGIYQLQALIQTTNPITGRVTSRTNLLSVNWTNGFSAVAPVVTNLAPPAPLAASQVFRWSGFGGSADYASFYVLEGNFDTNLLAGIVQQGASALTNLTVRHASPHLDAGPGNVTVTNLNPALDHIVWLEFDRSNPETNLALGEVSAVRANLMFHRRVAGPVIVVPPASQSVVPGARVTLEVIATGGPLTYQWRRDGNVVPTATAATLILENVTTADGGSYDVEVANAVGTVRSAPAVITVSDPTVEPPPAVRISRADGQLTLHVTGLPATRHVVERSDDLLAWTEHVTLETDGQGTANLRIAAAASQRAFRVMRP